MKSRDRISETLNHKIPDKVPIDFGSTVVTGIAVSTISKLREHYGLSNEPPVKVIDPYQMLGEIDDDLKEVLEIDCVELSGKKNFYGFEDKDWKPFRLFDDTEVLVPGNFNTKLEEDGSILQYPQGDKTVQPCAKMPKNGFYFDSLIRQKKFMIIN
jgi:hypothetical protein